MHNNLRFKGYLQLSEIYNFQTYYQANNHNTNFVHICFLDSQAYTTQETNKQTRMDWKTNRHLKNIFHEFDFVQSFPKHRRHQKVVFDLLSSIEIQLHMFNLIFFNNKKSGYTFTRYDNKPLFTCFVFTLDDIKIKVKLYMATLHYLFTLFK